MNQISDKHYYQTARTITLISLVCNALLSAFKITFGIIGYSHALLSDGVHSLSDLLTDAIIIFVAKVSTTQADEDHPYGHGRYETIATIFLAMIIMFAGGEIVYRSIINFSLPVTHLPSTMALIVTLASIALNEGLYHLTYKRAKEINSTIIEANAWHHRVDGFSSIIVLISILGTWLGAAHLDSVASILVAFFIFRMGFHMVFESVSELVDTGLDSEELAAIHQHILSVEGAQAVHQLRTRKMRGQVFLDVHIIVSSTISVSEGHFLADKVAHALLDNIANVTDVTVHVDPEDDDIITEEPQFPMRSELLDQLKPLIEHLPGGKSAEIVIHYLDGKVTLELVLMSRDLPGTLDLASLKPEYDKALGALTSVAGYSLRVLL